MNTEFGYDRENRMNAGDGLTRSLNTSGFAANISGQSFTTRIGLSSVLNARTFNSVVVAWSSDHRNRTPNSFALEQFINGVGALGGDAAGQHLFTSQQTQLSNDLTLTRGHNEFDFGGRLAAEPAYEQQEENVNSRFDYNSLAAYLDNQPRRFQQTFITGDTRFQGTMTELAFYANSRVQLLPNLFLTAGVRWAAQWNPPPPHPNPTLAVTQKIPDDLSQWQPRVALAWDVSTKMTVRALSGLYAAATPATFFHRVFADNGTQTVTVDSYFGAVQPRNIYRQPGFANLDLRVVKDFTLKGEGHHLDLFMDIFNLTGARNLRFDSHGVSLFGNASYPVYSAGMPLFAPGVTRLGGPREIQLTARLVGF